MTTSLLQEKLNTKADTKLREDVELLFNTIFHKNNGFDFNADLPKSLFREYNPENSPVNILKVISAIKHHFISIHTDQYRIKETQSFLKKIDSIEEDLTDLKNNLNL